MTTQSEQTRQLHDTLDFIGLRAHATVAGLLQLCSELVAARVIDAEAVERIKAAIHREIMIRQKRRHDRNEFGSMLKDRLDAIFPKDEQGLRESPAGDIEDVKAALGPSS